MARIVIDWLQRLSGHMQVRLEKEGNVITAAYVSGTAFRGWEQIMRGRTVTDAVQMLQRLCNTCSVGNSIAAAQAIEAVMGISPPSNAIILRNILLASSFLHNHLHHFYKLALLDYVEGPEDLPLLQAVGADIRIKGKDAGLFWEHAWQADRACCTVNEMIAICGGKTPHLAANIPGGLTNTLSLDKLLALESRLNSVTDFIEQVYLPDVYLLAQLYPEWLNLGKGWGNYLTCGAFPQFPAGVKINGELAAFKKEAIHEDDGFTWKNQTQGKGYSWIKAARYQGLPMEVGPLARMVIKGEASVGKLGQQANSVMGRHIARAEEAKIICKLIRRWLGEFKLGSTAAASMGKIIKQEGAALLEVPGGVMGHWLTCAGDGIANYQIIAPGTWNASPRDNANQPGCIEKALEGMPVTEELVPTFVGRVIRSFDPCLDCAAH